MIRFKDFHPVLLTVYFISVAAIGAVLAVVGLGIAVFAGVLDRPGRRRDREGRAVAAPEPSALR